MYSLKNLVKEEDFETSLDKVVIMKMRNITLTIFTKISKLLAKFMNKMAVESSSYSHGQTTNPFVVCLFTKAS